MAFPKKNEVPLNDNFTPYCASLFCAAISGLLSTFKASKHIGVLLGAIAYGGAAIASFYLMAWWPLALGFVLTRILRFFGFDPGEE